MKYFGFGFAILIAGAEVAMAADLGYETPPPEQVFTSVSAVDWTDLHFGGDAAGSLSDAFSATPFTSTLLPFRQSGRPGGFQSGYEIPDGRFVYAVRTNPELAAIRAAARDSTAENLSGAMTKGDAQDANGVQTLGVDVSRVGSTLAKVRRFLGGLPADAASNVRSGCAVVMGDQDNYHPRLLRFCTVLPEKSVATLN